MGQEKYCVSTGGSSFVVSLCKSAKFFSESCGPDFTRNWIIREPFILIDGFTCDRVDNWVGEMFKMGHIGWLALPFWEIVHINIGGNGVEDKSIECFLWDEVWCLDGDWWLFRDG